MPNVYENDIILIDKIFTQLKIGKEAILKFKSDVYNEIIVINGEWLHFKKNQDGIFEVKITPTIDEIYIMFKKGKSNNDAETSMILSVAK